MIGTLARKRTNLVALAAILALVAAMFVALAPARAAEGDVSANTAYCNEDTSTDPTSYRLTTDEGGSTPLTVDTATSGQTVEVACAKADLLKKAKVTANGTTSPTVEILDPELVLSLGGAAKVPGSVAIKAYVKDGLAGRSYTTLAPAAAASVTPASSGAALIGTPDAGGTVNETGAAADLTTVTNVFLSPTASGEYTVTVVVQDSATSPNYLVGTKTFTAGETAATPDEKVASAMLELDYSVYDDPLTSTNEAVEETGSTPAASNADIWLKLTVKNSLGEAAEDTDIESITIVGLNGTIGLYDPVAATPDRHTNAVQRGADGTHAITHSTAAEVGSTMFVKVASATATKVSVYAQINGQSVTSNTVPLTFSGAIDQLAVSDATKTLKTKDDTLKVKVTAMDKAGNEGIAVTAATVSPRVLDSDGKTATNVTAAAAQGTTASGATDPNTVEVTVTVNETTAAKSGTYTLEVSSTTSGVKKASTTFNIAGPAHTIELTADPETGTEVGERITLTATVTDESGVTVPDGTTVTFSTTAGGGASVIGTGNAETKDGVATAKLGVSSYGTTFVYADSGAASADLSFVSTANEPDPVSTEPSLGDLKNHSGLTSYSGPDTMASALMALLAGRGATAIWLSSGASWALYATADGELVPGATDFAVTSGDVLFISN